MPLMEAPRVRYSRESKLGIKPSTKSSINRFTHDVISLADNGYEPSIKLKDGEYVIIFKVETHDNRVYTVEMSATHYPFEPPSIKINDKHYEHYYKNIGEINHEFDLGGDDVQKIRGPLIKRINWFPICDFMNITVEIKHILERYMDYHRKKIQSHYCRKICDTYLVHDIPLEDHL